MKTTSHERIFLTEVLVPKGYVRRLKLDELRRVTLPMGA